MTHDTSPQNVLSSEFLSGLMLASLPQSTSSSTSSTSNPPHLTDAYGALALAAHSSLLAVGFHLISVGADTQLPTPSSASAPQPLPASWNAGHTSFKFRYTHPQSDDSAANASSPEFSLFVHEEDPFARITARVEGTKEGASSSSNIYANRFTAEVEVGEYISRDGEGFPFTARTPTSGADTDRQRRRIENIFISGGRLSDFGKLMRVRIAQKLVTAAAEDDADAAGTDEAASAARAQIADEKAANAAARTQAADEGTPDDDPSLPRPSLRDDHDPRVPPAAGPGPHGDPDMPSQERLRQGGDVVPPPFSDEHQMQRPRRDGPVPDPRFPPYGYDDLFPPGMGPGDFGGAGPGLGRGPPRGMFVDPADMGFGPPPPEGGLDLRHPPGSRYDPVFAEPGLHPRGAGVGGQFPAQPSSPFDRRMRGPGRGGPGGFPPGSDGFGPPGGFGSGGFGPRGFI